MLYVSAALPRAGSEQGSRWLACGGEQEETTTSRSGCTAGQAGVAGSYWVPSAVQQHFCRVVTQGSAVDAAARLQSLRQEALLSRQSLVVLQRSLPARLQRLEQAERDLRAMQGA
ncbi:hypothetical protein Vretimale_11148 [Volvox reticuliferus]|uniref:Uncharacterized protein n=1 Tax=Volvox reticuliferus TaxID=1737510 RepID=A0A8J4LR90_9CHLO|nr:hypothetical protein Vretifemale_17132 [Volvox reticuliferus]GIM06899.1 hypothetical protein Vretimale_11148 [Volvox reticuliferus]